MANGTVRCWGRNDWGRLGNGTTSYSSVTPVTVTGISTAVAVSAADEHTCALLANGTVWCWGYNGYGQLGNGTTASSSAPVLVTGLKRVVAISAGGISYNGYTCALLIDGTVSCWGDNQYFQLGTGAVTYSASPVTVSGISTAIAVSAGGYHSGSHACALLADGTARCWGSNVYGQVGTGTIITRVSVPVTIAGLKQAVSISAGGVQTCAVISDSTMKCWGANYGATTESSPPVTISGISTAAVVSIGRAHTCALLADSTLRCWGSNNWGQLGLGITVNSSSVPSTVKGLSTAVTVSAGRDHACAKLADTSVRCWGLNDAGQLSGPSSTTPISTPVTVGIGDVVTVSAGGLHTCAVLAGGTVWCWGDNRSGQLGNGTITKFSSPVTVSGISTAVAVSSGYRHTCALLADGTLRCWGDNSSGQLGNGTFINSSIPITVSGISTAAAVSSGESHTCALLADGTSRCWGLNRYGQLGNGTTTDSLTPVTVSGLSAAMAVSVGNMHSCALLTNGTVRCWGLNYNGELGNATTTDSTTPVAVSNLVNAVSISGGGAHNCATLADKTLRCWGYNRYGQLGNGTTTDLSTPITVSGLSTAVAVSAGNWHTCALLADGTLRCWGNNFSGQLGDGKIEDYYQDYYSVPAPTLGYLPLTWTSSKPLIASVDGAGQVKAFSSGTALITASVNGVSNSTTVNVPVAGIPSPIINGFWPGNVEAGQMVLVFGEGFVPLRSQVAVNGIASPFVQVVDPGFLFFMLPAGNTSGPITVTTPNGSATSTTNFGAPLTGVQITGLWPSVASPNQLVLLFGSGFAANATTVKVNGVDAPIRQVLYPDMMFFIVPPTATTGFVTVTTATGSGTSPSLLTIK
jgi:alpha-tubulin suppressor-like RCC1 family protein